MVKNMKINKRTGPLIIGGVGASGTRVYRAIAEMAGFNMLVAPWIIRRRHTGIHDNLLMRKFFYPRWLPSYLRNDLSKSDKIRMRAECRFFLWLCGCKTDKWGWKNPSTGLLIPFLHETYPAMYYIHVVRDGRDIAFRTGSKPDLLNDNNPNRSLIREDERKLQGYLQRALLWARYNSQMREHAHNRLSENRYLVSRFEDLYEDPTREIARIFAFLGERNTQSSLRDMKNIVQKPKSAGRWRAEPKERVLEVENLIGESLLIYQYPLSKSDYEDG